MQTRSWDDQNRQKRYTTEVVASSMEMLDSGQAGASDVDLAYGNARETVAAGVPVGVGGPEDGLPF